MSADGSTTINWPDDERRFRLGLGELRELQDKCDAGPAQIFRALSDQSWRIDYVRETIRLGLIGGGLDPQRALGLVGRYVVPGQLIACAGIAQIILYAALVGDPDTQEGKATAGTKTPTGDSPSRSTDQEPPSDGPRAKSMNAHSLSS